MDIVNSPIMNSSFFTILWINIIINNFIKIELVYNQDMIYIWSTYDWYTIDLMVARFNLWCLKRVSIFFAIQLSLYFVIKGVRIWINHNYTRLFYKWNFNIFLFSHILFKWKKWKFILELFSKGLHIHNKETSKIPNHLREKQIPNNNSQNTSSW